MGLFLHLAGVANSTLAEVEQALQVYASRENNVFEPMHTAALEPDAVIIKEKARKVSLLYCGDFEPCQKVSAFLSTMLKTPVLFLNIHDGDFWMYSLFVGGQVVDRFNPIPDYWDDNISTEERNAWKGNAATLCEYWSGAVESKMEKYLVQWGTRQENPPRRAYPGDIFPIEDEWQMLDFM